jgi:hypothetical protein
MEASYSSSWGGWPLGMHRLLEIQPRRLHCSYCQRCRRVVYDFSGASTENNTLTTHPQQKCLEAAIAASPCAFTDLACSCSNSTITEQVELCVLQSCTLKQSLCTHLFNESPHLVLICLQQAKTSQRRSARLPSATTRR